MIDASSTCPASSLSGTSRAVGHFYAVDASQRLGLGDEGALRTGMAPYNSREDADRLLNCVADFFADA
jgi:selenocysteine lyase/cysteine desulfurase